jgi:hypothetical protein
MLYTENLLFILRTVKKKWFFFSHKEEYFAVKERRTTVLSTAKEADVCSETVQFWNGTEFSELNYSVIHVPDNEWDKKIVY